MLNQLNQTRDNSITAARHLLQLLKVPVTETTLTESVLTHPDYPSLLSISDSLQHWNMGTTFKSYGLLVSDTNLGNEVKKVFLKLYILHSDYGYS